MATLLTILLTLSATDGELFETRIRPVLVEHCYKGRLISGYTGHDSGSTTYASLRMTTAAPRSSSRVFAPPYRDWVVRAFNDDLPYDQFVRYQIAGDLIGTDDPSRFNTDAITATGIWTFPHVLSDVDFDGLLADFVDQQIDVLGRTFLGLTLACARCHDHKSDPISQREYYSLAGIFFSSHSLTGEHPDKRTITGGRSAYRVESPIVSSRAELDDYRQLQKERRETTKKLGRMKRKYPEAFQIRDTPPAGRRSHAPHVSLRRPGLSSHGRLRRRGRGHPRVVCPATSPRGFEHSERPGSRPRRSGMSRRRSP